MLRTVYDNHVRPDASIILQGPFRGREEGVRKMALYTISVWVYDTLSSQCVRQCC